MKHRTAELEGALLDAAVALAENDANNWPVAYSTDWQEGGPIIERGRIQIGFMGDGHGWQAAPNPEGQADWQLPWRDGPTALIAAMRAHVASKFGEEVELP